MKCQTTGDFFKAWGGISSLQFGLPAIWAESRGRNYSLSHLVRWMCSGPAKLARVENHKGAIAAGYDADIVIWNPERRFRVQPKMIHHRHKLTPYAEHELRGVVEATFLRGEMIYDRGRFVGPPRGALLRRCER
jgi:allantoinase